MTADNSTRSTIADVARKAGVSIKTVSRVTNNEPNVRENTRAKVLKVIGELSYTPNPSARSLASRRSFLIGLIYDNPSASYLVSIQEGALGASRNAGYDLIIHPCDYKNSRLEGELTVMIGQSKVDGLILTPPLSDMSNVVGLLKRMGIPFVRVAPADKSVSQTAVYTNDAEVCAEMIRYLYSLGHRKIAFVTGHPDHGAVLTRFDGYVQGLKDCDLKLREDYVAQGYNSFESGIECAEHLLSLNDRPTAIFASNDDMAAGVMKVAHQRGLSIPAELSVAGFDDIPLARQLWPSLTTIRQPIKAMAASSVELLLAGMGSQPGHDDEADDDSVHSIASELIVRDSTGPLAAD